jgi:peptide/nickel transport system permease protein
MARYLLSRLVALIPTLIVLSLVTFLLTTAARGDPALLALQQAGEIPSDETLARYRQQLGLDQPFAVRYVRWLAGVVQGDLGKSFLSTRLGERIAPTLVLGLTALALSSIVGIALGTLFALHRGTWLDCGGRVLTLVLASTPSFCLAIGLVLVFGELLHWLPVAGYGLDEHLILPSIALAIGPAASLMRLTRARLLEELGQDYIRTATAKGLRGRVILVRHALRNAAIPLVSLIGLRFAHIFAGAVIIESVFSWPGMGSVLLTAISGRDLPVIGGYVLLAGLIFIVVNLVIDLSYVVLDPRVRVYQAAGR